MHAVIRSYSGHGANALFDLLEERTGDVEETMRAIRGFISYALVRTGEGGVSVTVCEDKAGTDESARRAREWVERNAADAGVGAPRVTEGPVFLYSR